MRARHVTAGKGRPFYLVETSKYSINLTCICNMELEDIGETAGAAASAISAGAAAATPPPLPTLRLALYTGSSDWKLERIYDEYSIRCLEGDSFSFSKREWYAIQLLKVRGRVSGLTEPALASRV